MFFMPSLLLTTTNILPVSPEYFPKQACFRIRTLQNEINGTVLG